MTTPSQIKPLLFETPTATLAVMTRSAAISQWSDRPVIQPVRFCLKLTGLTAIAADGSCQIEIQGDRDQLLPLQTAIQDYIQAQLTQAHPPLPRPQAPHLTPVGLLQHRLHLGSLRVSSGDRDITLGSLHLADLGDLFEQLDQQVRVLPCPLGAVARPRWRQWQSLAAGLVAAMGVVAIIPSLYPSLQPEVASSPPGESENAPAPDRTLSLEESAPQNRAPLPTPPAATTLEAPEAPEADKTVPTPSTTAPAPGSKTKTPAPNPPPPASARPRPAQAPETPQIAPRETVQDAQDAGDAAIAQSPPATFEAGSAAANPENAPSSARRAQDADPLAALTATLAERWQPPAALGQSLEYDLDIAPDGTLASIEPRDSLAVQYQAQARLPEIGAALLPAGEAQRLRVVLSPAGTVEITPVLGSAE